MKEGFIFTNDNCVGCNKCIGACSCPGATIATENSEGKNIIKIDGSKCIACGACFDSCEHKAREYKDDTASFFSDLKNGEEISILVAPAFVANYPKEYKMILGKLKALGVKRILSVAFGADITTWAYLNYINEYDFKGGISQPCPATVDYIEKYIPELIPKLIPVQSPMMCAAIYAKKEMKISDKLAFISPCIAKKNEIQSKRGQGIISYNVTFDHMMKYLRTQNIASTEADFEMEAGLGSVYPMLGGLAENILWFLGEDTFVRQVSGEKQMYGFLKENCDRILSNDSGYDMIDALNCADGCLCGTGVESGIVSQEDTFLQMHKIKEKSKNKKSDAWCSNLSPKERLVGLNKSFENLKLEDYLCSYTDKSEACKWKKPTEEQIEHVFDEMNKLTAESRMINCACCGYNSCRNMAEAIYNGFNHKENCIHFLKNVLEDVDAECPTILLIREKTKSIHVVKNTDESTIKSWIESGFRTKDYDTAIKDYIERYVDAADKERVLNAVKFLAIKKNLEKSSHYSTVYTRHSEDGQTSFFQMEFSTLKGKNDFVLTFKDVNDIILEKQEEENRLAEALMAAEQANRSKSTFLANMSHEIRTPINSILGMNEIILRESKENSVLEKAGIIKSSSEILLSLVNDILDFSKIESGKMELVVSEYELLNLIHDIYNIFSVRMEDKKLALIMDIDENLPAVLMGDSMRLRQVIINLMTNALKYTDEGSVTLHIFCSDSDQEGDAKINVEVIDTGIGIAKEDLNKLNESFMRLNLARNYTIEGTGLGINIVNGFLQLMDSNLFVDSQVGVGSKFYFTVNQKIVKNNPIGAFKPGDIKVVKSAKESAKKAFIAPDAKLLVVDDNEGNIKVFVGLLSHLKVKIDTASSGEAAVQLCDENKYDIVFMDHMMPGMDGKEAFHKIHEQSKLNQATPVFVLTANAVAGAKEDYLQEGFWGYLSKPIMLDKLETAIFETLDASLILEMDRDDEVSKLTGANSDVDISDFPVIEGVDWEYTKMHFVSKELLLEVLKSFIVGLPSSIKKLSGYYENLKANQEDSSIADYRILVHSNKSSAIICGIIPLAGMSATLEYAARDGQIETVLDMTPHYLAECEKYYTALNDYFGFNVADGEEAVDVEAVRQILTELTEVSEMLDVDEMDCCMEKLKRFRFEGEVQDAVMDLVQLVANLETDCMPEIIEKILNGVSM